MRDYYTDWELFKMWLKKLFRIKSRSAQIISQGKYDYDFDFVMKTKLRGGK